MLNVLFQRRTALVLSIAGLFCGWVLAGIDGVDGSDHYTLDGHVVALIFATLPILMLVSAWIAPQWRELIPKSLWQGILLGATALGVWGAVEGGLGSGLGVMALSLSVFGFLPYLLIALSLLIGISLGLVIRKYSTS